MRGDRPLASIIFSMVIFGTIGIFRRFIPVPSEVLAFTRGILGSVFLLLFLRIRGRQFDLRAAGRNAPMLILTGALIGLNWILLFEAYNYTSVAVATLCYYMQPVIVILVSPVLFRERLTLRKGICVFAACCGMVLVSGVIGGGGTSAGDLKGILLGLGAAVLYATVVLLNKKIQGVPVYEKTILQLSSASLLMIPYMLIAGSLKVYALTPIQAGCLLTVGILHTGIAYALYFGAIEKLPAQTSALLSYIDPVTAVLLSALLLHEHLSAAGVIGAVMILTASAAGQRR